MDAHAVPSPFLPGTKLQYAWDSTSLGLLKTCPRLYQYVILEGYTTDSKKADLVAGGLFHDATATYDRGMAEGLSHEDALRATVHEFLIAAKDYEPDPDTKAGKYKNKSAMVRAVIFYLDHRHETDRLKTYRLANGKPAVELSFAFEITFPTPSGQPYVLCGHLDRVCEDANGDLFIEDHKTTTTTPGQYYFDRYDVDNQMSLYTFAGKVILETAVHGTIINAVQFLIEHPYNRFVRGMTFRTSDQVEEWYTDLERWLSMAEWYASNDHWPMNDTACNNYGGCAFRKVCAKSPSVRNIYLRSDYIQLPPSERWNPLKPR